MTRLAAGNGTEASSGSARGHVHVPAAFRRAGWTPGSAGAATEG